MSRISEAQLTKTIIPSTLNFGFLGLGIMGAGIVRNLLKYGHKVVVWNKSLMRCLEFKAIGAKIAVTPSDVFDQVDITFSCVSDPLAAKEIVFGSNGVLASDSIGRGTKGYVEMTGIDDITSCGISAAIKRTGCRYLEAQLQGSKRLADDGMLIILAAGDFSLWNDCRTCFDSICNVSFFLGAVGNASKMYLVLQLISGISVAALAEGLALADRCGLSDRDVLEVMKLTTIASPMLIEQGIAIVSHDYASQHPLNRLNIDLRMALALSKRVNQPLPLTATVKELYKRKNPTAIESYKRKKPNG